MNSFRQRADFIWSIADLLRHDYKRADYGKVILPFTVLRRLDCVLESTKEKVIEKSQKLDQTIKNVDPILNKISGQAFHNRSKFDFQKLKADSNNIGPNLRDYINGFSDNAREIMKEYFKFNEQILTLDEADLLYLVVERFADIDLHPNAVNNEEMGYIFEELIRKFAEYSNETAGEHFTPREVIKLMVNLIYDEDTEFLKRKGIVRTLYDPACGTGGMLSVSEEHLKKINPEIRLEVFGQEVNKETYAVCKSEMMLKGQNASNIKYGNSFTQDGLKGEKFDYMLSNPPYGVSWKKYSKQVISEHKKLGFSGRFGAGYPRISDGQLLFLQHMISKMKQGNDGSRFAVVFNASPLFSGDAGSAESNIRSWIIKNDWLEAIIGLPDQLFYNTGISTFVWILTNKKNPKRKGKIQLINATSSDFYEKMSKNLGAKRNEIDPTQIEYITKIYERFANEQHSKIFDNDDFGYKQITIERPLRLKFQTSMERIELLKNENTFKKLAKSKKKGKSGEDEIEHGKQLQKEIIKTLTSIDPHKIYKNQDDFVKILNDAFHTNNIILPKSILNLTITSLSERDPTADVCKDSDGNPIPDTDLRDYEKVPLKEDIHSYFERETKPHFPDAWINEKNIITGYEIPFASHFYRYEPSRKIEQINSEIKKLEVEISDLLHGVSN